MIDEFKKIAVNSSKNEFGCSIPFLFQNKLMYDCFTDEDFENPICSSEPIFSWESVIECEPQNIKVI